MLTLVWRPFWPRWRPVHRGRRRVGRDVRCQHSCGQRCGGVLLLDKFTSDALRGGAAKKLKLAKVLCEKGGAGVEWLTTGVNLVARLGRHSAPHSFPQDCWSSTALSGNANVRKHRQRRYFHHVFSFFFSASLFFF